MKKNVTQEKVNHALDLARDMIHNLIMDGNDPAVVYSVFAIGCALSAHVHNIKEDAHIEGCRAVYRDLEAVLGELK